MPTNYSGVPTATQSPSAAPGPGVSPELSMPNDGEPLNVASLRQNEKVLADFIAWLTAPFAISGAWNQATWYVHNARNQNGFFFDHMGFPNGNLVRYDENWRGQDGQVGSGPSTFAQTQQTYQANVTNAGSGGEIIVAPPDGTSMTAYLNMVLGTGGSDISAILGKKACVTFANSQAVRMDWIATPGASGVNQQTFALGLGDPAGFVTPIVGFNGVMMYRSDATGANWQAVCGDGTALAPVQDTGVNFAASTTQHGAIEYWGSGVADDSTEAIRCYMGSTLVATFTTHLPNASAATNKLAPLFATTRTSGSTARSVSVGPYRIMTNN